MDSVTLLIQRELSARGLYVGALDGDYGPQTAKAMMAALNIKPAVVVDNTPKEPAWYVEAKRKMGLHEVTDNAELKEFLKSDGNTLGDPQKLPWCGDFVETCIARTIPHEDLPDNPYYALNWLKFGQKLNGPALGAIAVFVRPGGGHIGFYAGERDDAYLVLGGNQSNRVSLTWISKSRLKGFRWPSLVPLPRIGAVRVKGDGQPLSNNEA